MMDVSALENEDMFSRYYKTMPEYRRKKTDAIRPGSGKRLSLGVGILLEHAKGSLGIGEKDIASVEDAGRDAAFYYNLSHSGSRALCSVCSRRVGCDVERIRTDEEGIRRNIKVSARFFTKSEAEYINKRISLGADLPGQERADAFETVAIDFYKYWTLKESVIKVTGRGLSMPLDSFEIDISGEEPGLKFIGDMPLLGGKRPDGYRLYIPVTDKEYAYGLCIAAPEKYIIYTETIDP